MAPAPITKYLNSILSKITNLKKEPIPKICTPIINPRHRTPSIHKKKKTLNFKKGNEAPHQIQQNSHQRKKTNLLLFSTLRKMCDGYSKKQADKSLMQSRKINNLKFTLSVKVVNNMDVENKKKLSQGKEDSNSGRSGQGAQKYGR